MNKVKLNYNSEGLIPAIIQDADTDKVLMLGYLNAESYDKTLASGKVTFWSRSRKEIWTKGETSGNFLYYISMEVDCDNDTLLVKARPEGPTCHTGSDTCWNESNELSAIGFVGHLERVIDERYNDRSDESYTSHLFNKGVNKIAQKVGEEAVELVIEAKDENDDLFLGEAADLLFHYLVLLRDRGMSLSKVVDVLKQRHK
ncbi:MAG: phosphoribosyl-ATP pyrophosphohydrolase/phosphoribosyl-AMP cyclohydrolase [Saprospiraceae bacterium]|jgi:phosphoribosyl-ATP pyrophosphohydrolase/phosphoribosyl-AMP cyclohydrolase